jgi:homopolymeric O-antigen transport system permease protein
VAAADLPTIVIEPRRTFAVRWKELWDFRELFAFLIWRDIKVRYKQTALGASWALLQPLMLMVVFTLFIGQLHGVGPAGVPYPIFTLSALVPWTFFANAVAGAGNSVVGNAQLVSKVYFPRLLIPTAAAASYLIDLVISFLVLFAMMAGYKFAPSPRIVLVPVFILYVAIVAFGVGLLLAALNVRYRDVRYAVPFLIQFWLFASPVAYQFDVVGSQYRLIFALNPMVTGIEGFRNSVTGSSAHAPASVYAISAASAAVLSLAGLLYFRRVERTFADII